jgi:excisionase family DNA binding protein
LSVIRSANEETENCSMDDRWLSVEEIAEYLGVSKDAVYSWVSLKGMPGHRVARFWKFKRDEVDAWVRAGGAQSASDTLTYHRGGEE